MRFFNPLGVISEVSLTVGQTINDVRRLFDEANGAGRRVGNKRINIDTACGVEICGNVAHTSIKNDGMNVTLVFIGSPWKLKVLLNALLRQKAVGIIKHRQYRKDRILIDFRCYDGDVVQDYLSREAN